MSYRSRISKKEKNMIAFMLQGSEAEKSFHKVYYVAPAEIDSRTRQGQDNEKIYIYIFF